MGKKYEPANIRNIVISGAPNVGKTTLAESLLFSTGAIKEMGNIERGTTVMDFDEEEMIRDGKHSESAPCVLSDSFTAWFANFIEQDGAVPEMDWEVNNILVE